MKAATDRLPAVKQRISEQQKRCQEDAARAARVLLGAWAGLGAGGSFEPRPQRGYGRQVHRTH